MTFLVNPHRFLAAILDSYNRPDDALSLGTADTGQTYTVVGGGTWAIATNKARLLLAGGSGDNHAVIDSGRADGSVQASVVTAVNGAEGVSCRVQDVNNWVCADIASPNFRLLKRVAATYTTIATGGAATVGNTYTFKLVFTGTSLELFIDGVSKVTATDGAFSTFTKHGLRCAVGANAARFDDLDIR